jgi:hypothetical protein
MLETAQTVETNAFFTNMKTQPNAQTPPVSFFRKPACFVNYPNPEPIQKRTGEFAKPADIATDAALRRLETVRDELQLLPAFGETALYGDLNHLIQHIRAEVETRRERDFFGHVVPTETERGSGYLARCIIEDYQRALLILVAEQPDNYSPSFAKFLRPTKERVDKCRKELSCFSEEQICTAARDLVAHLATPNLLANMMVTAVSAATQDSPVQLRSLRLPVGSWEKTLRDGLVARLKKVQSKLPGLPNTTAGEPSPQEKRRTDAQPLPSKTAITAPHPTAKKDKATKAAPHRPKMRGANPECACGCGGHTKGGEFKPGHDSVRKRDLVAKARAGDKAALKELQQRNWEKFI